MNGQSHQAGAIEHFINHPIVHNSTSQSSKQTVNILAYIEQAIHTEVNAKNAPNFLLCSL